MSVWESQDFGCLDLLGSTPERVEASNVLHGMAPYR